MNPGSSPFIVSLLFRQPTAIDVEALGEALDARRLDASLSERDANGTFALRFADVVELEEGPVPASLALAEGAAPPFTLFDFAHSRRWPEGRQLAGTALHTITLSEMTTIALPLAKRMGLLMDTVLALVESHEPVAVHWPTLQRFDEPGALLEAGEEDKLGQLVNVRRFGVAGSDEVIMDTLGLCALGLLDLQAHFRSLPLADVAAFLDQKAAWLMVGQAIGDQSAWLHDGETTPGPDDQTWLCRYEMAMNEPYRGVVDLEPPAPFSARE